MKWNEFYKLPLHKERLLGGEVITPIENDEYHEAWDWIENTYIDEYPVDGRLGEQLTDAIVRYVNGESEYRPDFTWTKDEKDPSIICMNGEQCMCVRGWGELFGSLRLPYGEAAKIQDDFIDFLIKRLNGEI